MDKDGNPNLAPFSFFNAFSANPPTLIFSPARRGKDNTTKDSFENIKATKEVVINVVPHKLVHQSNLASSEYPSNVNEFEKAGLTPIPSEKIKPFRVKESPVHFECKVVDVIELAQKAGAGNLVICKILLIHIEKYILNDEGKIDPHKIDLIGRMGGNYYCRTSGDAAFEVAKPGQDLGIGIDQIPKKIRNSKILTGNELGLLGMINKLPSEEEINSFKNESDLQNILSSYQNESLINHLHKHAQELLKQGKVKEAWGTLLAGN